MDRFQVVGGDRYVSCPPAIDSVRVAMEGSHTWKGSIYYPGQKKNGHLDYA